MTTSLRMGLLVAPTLHVVLAELLHGGGAGVFITAINGEGNRLAGLDAQAHDGHQLFCFGGFAVSLGNGDGAVHCLGSFR